MRRGALTRIVTASLLFVACADGAGPHVIAHADVDWQALQSYSASGEELITTATQLVIAQCMNKFGFRYTPIPSDGIADSRVEAAKVDNLDMSLAATVGYHTWMAPLSPRARASATRQDVASSANESQSPIPGYLTALEGAEGGGGCVRQAYDRMRNGHKLMTDIYAEQVAPAIKEIVTDRSIDPRTVRLDQDWSACMKKQGLHYSNPTEARISFSRLPDVRAAELNVATNDSTCRTMVNWADRTKEIECDAVGTWIESNGSIFEALQEARQRDVKRAKELIDEIHLSGSR